MSIQFTVACRILETNEKPILNILSNNRLVLKEPSLDKREAYRSNRQRERIFQFDYVFHNNSQEEVYMRTTKNMVKDVIGGFNCTVFSYGPTGSGKTFTMLGERRNFGIVWRALEELTNYLNSNKTNGRQKLTISMFELYNENIRDLFGDSEDFLELREDKDGKTVVVNLSEFTINSMSEVKRLLNSAIQRRSCEPTWANNESSRSHAVIKIVYRQVVAGSEKEIGDRFLVGRLYLVDLAGTERAAQTRNRGQRFIEEGNINSSLLALKNCIDRLANGRGNFINYRDSKLTRVLKECLNGTSRTVMIAHVRNSKISFYETANTLYYAQKTMGIKTMTLQPCVYAESSEEVVTRLKKELKNMQELVLGKLGDSERMEGSNNKLSVACDEMKFVKFLVIRQNQLLHDNGVKIPDDVNEMYRRFLRINKLDIKSPTSPTFFSENTDVDEKIFQTEIASQTERPKKNFPEKNQNGKLYVRPSPQQLKLPPKKEQYRICKRVDRGPEYMRDIKGTKASYMENYRQKMSKKSLKSSLSLPPLSIISRK